MLKRIFFLAALVLVAYFAFIFFRINRDMAQSQKESSSPEVIEQTEQEQSIIQNFAFTKYSLEGRKELEIQGDSATMAGQQINLSQVLAKAYEEGTPVTVTADEGEYDRENGIVHLRKNVVAVTEDGARMTSSTLDMNTQKNTIYTKDHAEITKDEMYLKGLGALCHYQLKQVDFYKDIFVIFKKRVPEQALLQETVITCDGPLHVDYDKDYAEFHRNVVAVDPQGTLAADRMDVFYDRGTKELQKIFAAGNVVVDQEGNKTFSDTVVYLAPEGRVILEGDPEAYGIPVMDKSTEV